MREQVPVRFEEKITCDICRKPVNSDQLHNECGKDFHKQCFGNPPEWIKRNLGLILSAISYGCRIGSLSEFSTGLWLIRDGRDDAACFHKCKNAAEVKEAILEQGDEEDQWIEAVLKDGTQVNFSKKVEVDL